MPRTARTSLLCLFSVLVLTACGGEEQTLSKDRSNATASVTYSYPVDGQIDVTPRSSITLRFSEAVATAETEKIRLYRMPEEDPVGLSLTRKVDGARSVVLTPDAPLRPGEQYALRFQSPLNASSGATIAEPNGTGASGIQFATRPPMTDSGSQRSVAGAFDITDVLPDGNKMPVVGFSSFNVTTSQPIHPDSVIYGTTVSLRDNKGQLVPARTWTKGNHLTIDPCTTSSVRGCGSPDDSLEPGQEYTLRISGVTSQNGDTLSYRKSFSVRSAAPTQVLYQTLTNQGQTSRLNGMPINSVTLDSILQGEAGPSEQAGALYAELAYAPSFAGEPMPLRLPRGTVLRGASLDLKVNGSVPITVGDTASQQKTGPIKVTTLSDATGYLLPNPYTDDPNAPRHVRLWMNVAMNASNAQPNAALSQSLMRMELNGIALVRDGLLTIDALGTIEPNLLGRENAHSTIAFQIQANTATQYEAPQRPVDDTGPQLVSWSPGPDQAFPGDRHALQRAGDPVVLNFDEPIEPESVEAGLSLFADGTPVDALRTRVDGTTVTVNPESGLNHTVSRYQVQISPTLTDLSANSATGQSLSFSLPSRANGSSVTQRSPIALSVYPGYPCVTTDLNLAQDDHGFCVDRPQKDDTITRPDGQSPEHLPVTQLPANRPIRVQFSQPMELSSIRTDDPTTPENEGTFRVEAFDPESGQASPVPGQLRKNRHSLTFIPESDWDPEQLYRYTLVSNADKPCNGAICGQNGLPLQTDVLVDPEDVGGPPMTIYFRGAQPRDSVFMPLSNLPARDGNANYEVDCDTEDCPEPFEQEPDGEGGYQPAPNSAKLAMTEPRATSELIADPIRARIGCNPGQNQCTTTDGVTQCTFEPAAACPMEKFIYQTYGIHSEVVGPVDPNAPEKGARVLLYPTLLMTTSARVELVAAPEDADSFDLGPQPTGPQILRMRYAKNDPDCVSDCERSRLIPGVISSDESGRPVFTAKADLMLDAPNLEANMGSISLGNYEHNLFGYPLSLDLEGPIRFLDDGRMQIRQSNTNEVAINARVTTGSTLIAGLPLKIPAGGVLLNFISPTAKKLPAIH